MGFAAGRTLTANGSGFDNFGTLTMGGGRIAGNGPVVNDIGGLMQVSGGSSVAGTFTNLGVLQVAGSLLLSSGGENTDRHLLIAPGGGIRGGAFTNAGTLALSGARTYRPLHHKRVEGGVLLSGGGGIGGTFVNGPGGIIQVAAGNTLTIVNPLDQCGAGHNAGGTLGSGRICHQHGCDPGRGHQSGGAGDGGMRYVSGEELDLWAWPLTQWPALRFRFSQALPRIHSGLEPGDERSAIPGRTRPANAGNLLNKRGAVSG